MARLVAQSLAAGFANSETGECRPGAATIAEDCATSVKTVERVMRELELGGWVERLGGNAPGIRAAIRFRFPGEPRSAPRFQNKEQPSDLRGEHPSELAGEHPSDLSLTPLSSEFPPRPPYKDQPNMNYKTTPKTGRQNEAPKERPTVLAAAVPMGSDFEADWNAWLMRNGFEGLPQIGRVVKVRGERCWDMPSKLPPADHDLTANMIGRRFAEWLTARA